MKGLLSCPLGCNLQPFGYSKKCDPLGLFGAFANIFSTSATNSSNWNINTANNRFAEKMYNQQVADNRFDADVAFQRELQKARYLRQFDLEDREYNLPKNQVERYKDAGINPFLAMQNQSAGIAQNSVGSGSSAPIASPGQTHLPQSIPMDFSGIGLGIQKFADYSLASARQAFDMSAERKRIDIEAADTISKIMQRNWQNKKLDAEMNRIWQDFAFQDQTMDDRVEQIQLANQKIRFDGLLAEQQYEAQKFTNSVLPELHELEKKRISAEISVAAAQVAELNARTDLTEQQKKTEVERTKQEALVRLQLPKQLHNENAIRVATYNQIQKQSEKIAQETKTERWRTVDASKTRYKKDTDRSVQDYLEYVTDASDALIRGKKSFRVIK